MNAMNEKQIQELVREWTARAEECQQWEARYRDSDRVTSKTSKAAKEVYITCARELSKTQTK